MNLSQNELYQKDREARYKTRLQSVLEKLVTISGKITLMILAVSNMVDLASLTIGMELKDKKMKSFVI